MDKHQHNMRIEEDGPPQEFSAVYIKTEVSMSDEEEAGGFMKASYSEETNPFVDTPVKQEHDTPVKHEYGFVEVGVDNVQLPEANKGTDVDPLSLPNASPMERPTKLERGPRPAAGSVVSQCSVHNAEDEAAPCKVMAGPSYCHGPKMPEAILFVDDVLLGNCSVLKRQRLETDEEVRKRIHSGERPHVCDLCGAKFSLFSSLTKHKIIHTGDATFKCDMCDARFADTLQLEAHRSELGPNSHDGVKPFACEYCTAKFISKSSLIMHRKMHRRINKMPTYRCVCSAEFCTFLQLELHKDHDCHIKPKADTSQMHRTSKMPTYRCDVCSTEFRTFRQLEVHKKDHDCNKQPNDDKTQLGAPMNVCFKSVGLHSDMVGTMSVEPYTIGPTSVCSESVGLQCNLAGPTTVEPDTTGPDIANPNDAQPQSEEDKSKTFICVECKASLVSCYSLVLHRRMHRRKYPGPTFRCDVCFVHFMSVRHLELHKKDHKSAAEPRYLIFSGVI